MAQRVLEENNKAKLQLAKAAVEAAVSRDPENIKLWETYVPKGYGIGEILSLATNMESFIKEKERVSILAKVKSKIQSLVSPKRERS